MIERIKAWCVRMVGKKTKPSKKRWGLTGKDLEKILQAMKDCSELNIYLSLTPAQALDRYNEIINLAENTKLERIKEKKAGVYYEGHHILPVCMGGQGDSKNPNHENIVLLRVLEHYMAHFFFALAYPDDKRALMAFGGMSFTTEKRFLPPSLVEASRISGKITGSNHHNSRPVWVVSISVQDILEFGSSSEARRFIYGENKFTTGGIRVNTEKMLLNNYLVYNSEERAKLALKLLEEGKHTRHNLGINVIDLETGESNKVRFANQAAQIIYKRFGSGYDIQIIKKQLEGLYTKPLNKRYLVSYVTT